MASSCSGIAKMKVEYQWNVNDIMQREPSTCSSRMIVYRGVKVFRICLRNDAKSPVLFVMVIGLNRIGFQVESICYGTKNGETATPQNMVLMKEEEIGDGYMQIFNRNLSKQVTGNTTFVFRIFLEGSVPDYSYSLSDRLAKDQLWAAAKSQNGADVEIVVSGKTFPVHKAILADRSPVFEAEFTKEQQGNDQPVQIQIDDVDPSTVERFLYFIYTGESMGTLANEELLKLAEKYQLTTLTRLCQNALKKLGIMQLKKVMDIILTNETETSAPFATR